MNYGKALRIIRSTRNLSQKQLSEVTKLDPSYISLIEKDKRTPTMDTLKKIADALNIPLYLFVLLASDKSNIKNLSDIKKSSIARTLLDILISAEKEVEWSK